MSIRPSRQSHQRAYTLVELLIVIGIVAVLISILLPAMGTARKQAQSVRCSANLRNMGTALTGYATSNGFYPGHCSASASGVTIAIWPTRLRKFLSGNRDVFYCPSQDSGLQWQSVIGAPGGAFATGNEVSKFGYLLGERLLDVHAVPFCYGYNDWGAGNLTTDSTKQRGLGADIPPSGYNVTEIPVARVKNPSEMIAIGDGIPDTSWDFNLDPFDPTQGLAKIHFKGCNILFADGHVEWRLQQTAVLFDVSTGARLPAGGQYNLVARLWNNDNKP